MASPVAASLVGERPRLNLKPRDPEAAKKLEVQRSQSLGKNPFGDAKPREAVIASRSGKTEEEILKEEVKAQRLKLRLNPQQLEEQRAAESAIDEVKELIAAEGEGTGKDELQTELAAREAALDELMDGFAKLALEAAARGEVQRPSERRREQLQREGSAGYPGGVPGMPSPGVGGRGGGSFGDRGGYGGDRAYGGGGGDRGGYTSGGRGSFGDRRGGYEDRRGGGGYEERRGPPDARGGGGYNPYGDKRGSYEGGGRRDFAADGPRGFSNYQDRASGGGPGGSFDDRRAGGGGGDYGRRGGGGGGGRDYNGPSDRNNVETFGLVASGPQYSRGRRDYGDGGYTGGERGGGGYGGGGGYREAGGFGDEPRGYGGGGGGDPVEYGGGSFERGEGAGFVQDRF